MAENIKKYTIQINGVTESVNAVKSLNEQLKSLEDRIKVLQDKAINIKTNISSVGATTSSASKSASSSVISTENEIIKQQNEELRLQAKINAARDESFKALDATKAQYKEIIADQKQVAAQERINADAYSHTMQGMKQQLADLKAVINTTVIDEPDGLEKISEYTKKANELTDKLKKMEEAYGTFSRNVGNYQSAFDGLDKYKITIGGVTREFDNAKQAAKILSNELLNLPKGAKGADELHEALLKIRSDIADLQKSSSVMDNLLDTMESFTAIANVGQGIRGLFGVDDAEMQKSIKNLVALQNILKGIETINKQMKTGEGIGGWIKPFTTQIDGAIAKLVTLQTTMKATTVASKAMVIGLKAATLALKAFKAALSLGISIAVDLAIEKVLEMVEALKEGNKELESTKKVQEEGAKAYAEAAAKIALYKQRVESFNGTKKQEKKLVEEFNKELGEGLGTYKSISEVQKALIEKSDAYCQALKNEAEAQALLNLYTEAYVELQRVRMANAAGENDSWFRTKAGDMQHRQELENEAMDKANKAWDAYLEKRKQIAQHNKDNKLFDYSDQIDKGGKKSMKAIEDSQKTLNELEMRLMREGLNKKLRQLDEEERQTINKLKENGRKSGIEIQKVQRTYAELRQKEINEYLRNFEESIKKTARDIKNIKFDINLKDIEIEVDNLKNKFEDISTKGFPISTNTFRTRNDLQNVIGNLNLNNLKNAYLFNSLKAFGDDKVQVDRYYELLENYLEGKNEKIKDYFEKLKKEVGKYDAFKWLSEQFEADYRNELSVVRSEDISFFNLTEDYLKNSEKALAGSFRTRINMTNAYYTLTIEKLKENIKEQSKLNKQRIKEQWLQDEDAERDRYTKQYQELERQKKDTEDTIANFKVRTTEEQKDYEDLQRKLKTINEQMEEALKLHGEKMGQLTEAKNNAIKKNELDTAKEIQSTQQKFYDLQVSNYRDMQSKLNNEISKNPIQNSWGIINISQTKKNYNEIIEASKTAINAIKDDRKKLEEDLNNGLIGQDAYNATKNQLNDLETEIKQGMYSTNEASKQLIGEFVGSLNQYFQILGQSIQQIMSSVWDYQDYQFEKQQDELDKWNEELDKKLDEQQEIVEKHKDAIDSIEDELSTARGSRRQHLIDQLNAEMEAQREARRQEEKIQKEKEKAEKKQEQLDKKRREEEYKRNVTQAFISWHLSIANGLATQPFLPVGIAMGALATALGAVQYALVKSQKPYEAGGRLDGGVAQGKRHRDGGIPVLGGRASIEGGEFITNRITTGKNVDLLDYINSKKKRIDLSDMIEFYGGDVKKNIKSISPKRVFADGGVLNIPTITNDIDINDRLISAMEAYAERPYYVAVTDIENKMSQMNQVRTLAGLSD